MAGTVRTNWLSATDKQAALARIGFHRYSGSHPEPTVDRWNVLNWFVRLANSGMPFSDMAEAEVELLRQEYRALQEEDHPPGAIHGLVQNVVSIKDLEKFRSAVRLHVEQLADAGHTTFGPFKLERSIYIRPQGEIVSGEFVEPFDGQGLLLLMSRLLQSVGLPIRRCPRCAVIFLMSRRDAKFCSRVCQANEYASHQREQAKKQLPKRSARKVKGGR